MRCEDIIDYFKLRSIAANPLEIIQFRKNQRKGLTLVIQFLNGHRLCVLGGTDQRHIFQRVYLRDEYRLDRHLSRNWECVVDLGANAGFFSTRVASFCRRVISYEPISDNFTQLKKNVEGLSNVFHVQEAVAGEPGTVRIYRPLYSGSTGRHSIYHEGDSDARREFEEVPCITLDQLFDRHQITRCDLLKIDVEGAEYDILRATSKETFSKIHRIFGEYHPVGSNDRRMRVESLASHLQNEAFEVEVVPKRKKKNYGLFFAVRACEERPTVVDDKDKPNK